MRTGIGWNVFDPLWKRLDDRCGSYSAGGWFRDLQHDGMLRFEAHDADGRFLQVFIETSAENPAACGGDESGQFT